MKIAIKGHKSRGKEVIQILESLGGNNLYKMTGSILNCTYYINSHYIISGNPLDCITQVYKVYTLEEFEKEFPFKVGDKVITSYGNIGIIRSLTPDNDEIPYCIETEKGYIYRHQSELKLYKEMNEERNITLTLDKAKEWYKKGGELKEVALQAYSEEELSKVDLPKTWEEFCNNYMINDTEAYFDTCGEVYIADKTCRHSLYDRTICPSKESAKAHLAMMQLEQLRDCWRQGWKLKWDCSEKWSIYLWGNKLIIGNTINISRFLTFPTKEMAEEFLKCFRDLIEKAGDLI